MLSDGRQPMFSHAADRAGLSNKQPLLLASSGCCEPRSVDLLRPSVTHVTLSVSERFYCSTEWWTAASSAGSRGPESNCQDLWVGAAPTQR